MSLTKRNNRFLRVYQSHRNGFTTVPANLTTTAQELCETLMKKSKVPLPQGSLSLYVCESSDHRKSTPPSSLPLPSFLLVWLVFSSFSVLS